MAHIGRSPTRSCEPSRPAETARYCVCDRCRLKKIRCDMSRPTCGSCRARRIECTYSKRRAKPGPQKKSMNARQGASADVVGVPYSETPREPAPVDLSPADLSFEISPNWTLNFATPAFDCASLPGTTTGASPEVYPDMERYLLDLYLRHVQPTYPLFRRQPPNGTLEMSGRLKMAMFAVASRFAAFDGCAEPTLTPAEYAKRAQELEHDPGSSVLSLDKIKASILLCIYHLTESGQWESIAEVGKLARMAEWYYTMHVNGLSTESSDEEEWRSVWWTIYTLDVICSAVAASSHSTGTHLQQHIELPALSVSEFTESLLDGSSPSERSPSAQLLSPSVANHWETVQNIFYGFPGRSRNLYLGVSSIMRAVTELRITARYNREPALHARLSALESDCAAVTFALPSWLFHPTRYFDAEETADEHRSRLGVLLVLYCARILLKVTMSKVVNGITPETAQEEDCRSRWQALLSEAVEVVSVLQSWRPDYFEAVDPMCSYIIFLAACILILNEKADVTRDRPRSSVHIDLAMLFLSQVGQYWPLASRLKGSLHTLQALSARWSYRNMLQCMFETTNPVTLPCVFESPARYLQTAELEDAAAVAALPCNVDAFEVMSEQRRPANSLDSGMGWFQNDAMSYGDILALHLEKDVA